MLQINNQLKNKLLDLNTRILSKYEALYNDLAKNLLVNLIELHLDEIRQVRRFDVYEINNCLVKKGLVAVDGSINTIGSTYPHYVSIMQAIAKNTLKDSKEVLRCDIHSPLLNNTDCYDTDEEMDVLPEKDRDDRIRSAKLARLELEASIESMITDKPSVVFMDGSLTRYKIQCGQLWYEFKKTALQNDVCVAGIVEEIKTSLISKALKGHIPQSMESMFDREILFGVLEYGQVLMLKNFREEDGIRKCFMRSSRDPHVVAIDMLEEQSDKMLEVARLVLSLTPENSRGIPVWLDIVDSEVRISDKMMNALVETYIDSSVRNMLFVAKRENRIL
ncbi:MAG: DNA double-strand break repair nuclease NurA [Bacillota bacterium]